MKTKKKTKGYFAGGIALAAQMATDAAGNYVQAANYQFDPNKDPYKIDPVSALKAGPLTLIPELIKWQKDKEQRNSHIAYASPGNYAKGGPILEVTDFQDPRYRKYKEDLKSYQSKRAHNKKLIKQKESEVVWTEADIQRRIRNIEGETPEKIRADLLAEDKRNQGYVRDMYQEIINGKETTRFRPGQKGTLVPAGEGDEWDEKTNRYKGISKEVGVYKLGAEPTPVKLRYDTSSLPMSSNSLPKRSLPNLQIAHNLEVNGQLLPMTKKAYENTIESGTIEKEYTRPSRLAPNTKVLQYATGGQMEDVPLANNSFQVKGAPNQRDGNHYPQMNANLDHNEVVKGNFVFSNRLKNPTTGKPFAVEAKTLETATGKAQRILKANPNDPFANNTINLSNSRIENLAKLQEAHATSMGLRDNKTKNLAVGGYADGPGDPVWPGVGGTDISRLFKPGPQPKANQPYMHLKGDYYYDPYTQSYMWRNPITGSYKKETGEPGFSSGKGFRPYFKREGDIITPLATTTQDTEVNPISISKHLSQFPGDSNTELTLPWNVPEDSAPIPQDIPTTVRPRTGGTGKAQSKPTTKPAATRSPLDFQLEADRALLEEMQAAGKGNLPIYRGEYDEGIADPNAPVTSPVTSTASPRAMPDINSALKFGQGNAGDTGIAGGNYKVPFTAGDALQLGAIGSRFAQLIGGADKDKANYDTTKITKENYDPANALYQANRTFQNASNTIDAPSINTRRSIQNSLYAQRLGQENNILSEYDQRNQGANTQYEGRIADQRRYNNQQTVLTNDLNQRNKDAYRNAVTSAFDTLGNYGKGLNTKKQGGDIMNILKVSYPDVYARIIGGLMEDGTKKAKTT